MSLISSNVFDSGRCVSDDALQEASRTLESWRKSRGFKHFVGPQAKVIADIFRQESLFRTCEQKAREDAESFCREHFGRFRILRDTFYVIRCVDNQASSASHLRHFDSHAMTILTPIRTAPSVNANGDLIVYAPRQAPKNSRQNFFAKVTQKIGQSQEWQSRKLITQRDCDANRAFRVPGVAGHTYAFNGLVTQHCNLEVDQGERWSLLIHDYAPILDFGIGATYRFFRRRS